MKISHAWLQEYFKDTLPSAESLADLFTFHTFEIEGVEEKGDDKIIDAKVLPDRAHFCLSYRGIAEEVKVLTGLSLKGPEEIIDVEELAADASLSEVKVRIEDEHFCRRYVARRVSNLAIKASPDKVKAMLEAMDGRAINTVVDATNLAMFDYGQPLHAFDADKVKGEIVVRAAKEGEMITLLDGKEITLTSADQVIADDEGSLAIAGVKGGKRAEVNMETKNIIIESANFHPASVRKTSTKYNLRNESSKRFENEITPEWAMDGMIHVSALITKLSPDAKFGPIADFYPHPVTMVTIVTNADFIAQKLGITISSKKVKEILESLSIKVEEKENILTLSIPHHRLDLRIPEDIVEEVGRIYGYDKIEGTKQTIISSTAGSVDPVPAHPHFYIQEQIKNTLVMHGFSEAYLYAFTNKGDVEVAYPLASDKKALRTNLSDGMQKALETNSRNADLLFLDSIKMFEMGKVFTQQKGEEIKEHASLCIGIKRIKKVKGQSANEDIRQLREELLLALGTDVQTVCTIDDTGGLLMIKNPETGKVQQMGTINHIDGIMELNLDLLVKALEADGKVPAYGALGFGPAPKVAYTPFSAYPFMVRDVAVFVPESISSDELGQIIISNGTELLVKHRLFDTFPKDGKTSYAFRLIFQSYGRTLTDEEINKVMEGITSKLIERGERCGSYNGDHCNENLLRFS